MRFFIDDSTDPAFNLALEEALCAEFPEPVLMLWRNRPSVIVGRNQNTLAEVNTAFVREHGIDVVRRMTGGSAVYHDLGNVNYSFIIHERHPEPDSFALFARPVVACLRSLGVPAVFSGRNDILAEGRKISGSAQCCMNGRTLFHGTLLFDLEMEMLEKVLTPGKAKIESKGVRSVRAHVANLKEFLPGMSTEDFLAVLAEKLIAVASAPGPVPDEWRQKAEKLAGSRYRKWEWNYTSPFEFDWENSARFPAGTVDVKVKVAGGRIGSLRITGDFFGSAGEIEGRLTGIPFTREAVAAALEGVEMEKCIFGLSTPEFLSLITI